MKFAEDIFPKGTFSSQQTDGAYIDQTLSSNLDILARKIKNDMHFLILITGHDGVGNGKSTLMTQVGSYLTWKINQLHKIDNSFTSRNMTFNGIQLEKRSFELPQYSVVGLDEGDDLTTHGMKDLAIKLKRYFRKCRQLNQILILILPSYFELPKFYALSRSVFLLDVQFKGEFDRGFFDFYSSRKKKLLYLRGKKEWDYDCVNSDFHGKFFGSYCFFPDVKGNTERYKVEKYRDMIEEEEQLSPKQIELHLKYKLCQQFRKTLPNLTNLQLADSFEVDPRTIRRWLNKEEAVIGDILENGPGQEAKIMNILSKEGHTGVEEGTEHQKQSNKALEEPERFDPPQLIPEPALQGTRHAE